MIGQKIELWRIEGGKHPHRVVDRRIVTIRDFVGVDERGDPLSLLATDCRRREYLKPRPAWSVLSVLELLQRWKRTGCDIEEWLEAVVATTHAYYSRPSFHYSDGHGHLVKPSYKFEFCRKHHLWTHKGWRCDEKGQPTHNHNHSVCYSEH